MKADNVNIVNVPIFRWLAGFKRKERRNEVGGMKTRCNARVIEIRRVYRLSLAQFLELINVQTCTEKNGKWKG